ncbi:MAG TPA: radical SAM protein [Candidatus Margulisiibacteriota bacterium]|nr:radical SAM protein [Candidatus Margulisiibacteriota bacterium]
MNNASSKNQQLQSAQHFAVSKIPKVIHVSVSRACNIHCIMCPINRESVRDKEKFIEFETFQRLFKEDNQFGFLNFVGIGEVFVNKDFPRILEYCFEKNFSALGCTTNLQLISRELAEHMVKNGFQQITASIDGCTKETFEHIRKGASFDKFIETIEYINLLKAKYHSLGNPQITFAIVAMNSNIHEFPGLVRLARKLNVNEICVARLHVSKEDLLHESMFFYQEKYNHYYDETIAIAKELEVNVVMPDKFGSKIKKIRSVRDCKFPFENMYVDVDGVVYPCVCRVNPDVFVGNIKEQSVAEIWNSPKFQEFRAAFYTDNPPRQCQECTFSVLDPSKLESHMTIELADRIKKLRLRVQE